MATMSTTDRLLSNVRNHVPGVMEGSVQLALFDVMFEFFKNSGAWQGDITVPTVVGQDTYTLEPDQTIARLLYVKDVDGYTWPATLPGFNLLTLLRAPQDVRDLYATVSYTVSSTDDDGLPIFPEAFMDRYYDGLQSGVMAKLFSQPAKPYSSPQMAVAHMSRFNQTIAEARVETRREYTAGAQRWQFPQAFTRTRRL